jgi:hypothetical protein
MENQPKKSEEKKTPGSSHEKGHFTNHNHLHPEHKSNDSSDIDDTDKYLAMEQPGVKFTNDTDPTVNSDQIDFGTESRKKEWSEDGGNSKNSDAFNQDDYLLEDNVDLDEDEGKSISSDDDDFEETNERY